MLYNVLFFIVLCGIVTFCIALALILSQRPRALDGVGGLAFDRIDRSAAMPPLDDARFERGTYAALDGQSRLVTRVTGAGAEAPLIVMVHGSGWHGAQFDRLAWALRDVAEIRAVTLRGHGEAPERRGDVDYIGQLEDDLAALIRAEGGARRVYLLGHSSGGGLVIRFAGGAHRGLIDRAILLAPFLHHAAPTARENAGGWAHVLTRRIIGLSMLNSLGIHRLDHLKIIQFAFPKSVLEGPEGRFATQSYSWRLNLSFAPRRNYLGDIAKLPRFLLVAGAEDEAFQAKVYQPTMEPVTASGQYVLLDGVGHLDVVDVPGTQASIREFLQDE